MRLAGTALVIGYYTGLGWLLGGPLGLALGCVPAAVVLGIMEPALGAAGGHAAGGGTGGAVRSRRHARSRGDEHAPPKVGCGQGEAHSPRGNRSTRAVTFDRLPGAAAR